MDQFETVSASYQFNMTNIHKPNQPGQYVFFFSLIIIFIQKLADLIVS